ncbi:MAG: tetratricopeptide repeat protein [Planctomycetaceae bacterium]|nr:tetratricopeptide repeat protein [Planctomycetaceae bacterium]MCA9043121.1 tetratricopeptide repeat protein [Planctomycetaceae bacterium]
MTSRRWLIGLALVLVLAGGAWFYQSRATAPRFDRSTIDTANLHPSIAEALEQAIGKVEASPRSAESWGELGMVLMAHDLADSARQCFRQAQDLDDTDMRWPYLLGYTYEEVDYQTALVAYREALTIDPNSVPVRIRVATIQMRLGLLDEAHETLKTGLATQPANPYLLTTLGRLHVIRGELSEAEQAFTAAAQQPDWMAQPALLDLVKLAVRQHNLSQATAYQQRLLQLPQAGQMEFPDPVIERVRFLEGLSKLIAERADLALARGDARMAASLYEAFVAKRPDMPNAQVNLAQAYAMSGNWPAAIQRYQSVLDEFGENVAARYGLAAVYSQSGQAELAKQEYQRVIDSKPDHKNAWLQLGILQEQSGNLDEALDCYLRASEIDPSFAQAQLASGIMLMNRDDLTAAAPYIERAVQLSQGDPLPQQYLQELRKRQAAETPEGN